MGCALMRSFHRGRVVTSSNESESVVGAEALLRGWVDSANVVCRSCET